MEAGGAEQHYSNMATIMYIMCEGVYLDIFI